MALYLWDYEANYHFLINIICYILAANGKEIKTKDKQENKNKPKDWTFGEIKKLGIQRKLVFLMENGMGIIVYEKDTSLRNNIAHYNFLILEDGTVKFIEEGKKKTTIKLANITSKQEELYDFIDKAFPILWKGLSKYSIHPLFESDI